MVRRVLIEENELETETETDELSMEYINVLNSIENFMNAFIILANKHGFVESYKALLLKFKEIHTTEDVLIKAIINGLVFNNTNYYVNFLNEFSEYIPIMKELIDENIINHIEYLDENGLE